MQFVTRPLIDWPRPVTANRRRADYSVTYDKTLRDLEREVEHLKVTGDVVIQLEVPEHKIRRDGLPMSDARPATPRVAIAFTGKYGPMVYRCDVHPEWRDNVRAIVLGLQRLRLVAETGVTSQGEQYTGFRALPPGIPLRPAMTVEEAARVIAAAAAPIVNQIIDPMTRDRAKNNGAYGAIQDPGVFRELYRMAAKATHSDAGDKPDEWRRVQEAAEILKKHHNIS